jgi:hypothetical protein
MPPPRLAVLVSYCSNERPFVRKLLREALASADVVVVSIGERLYTGEPEDEAGAAALEAEFGADGRVRFVRYAVPDDLLQAPIELHNRSRSAAVEDLRRHVEYRGEAEAAWWVLLLDGDEVPDGALFAAWWRVAAGADGDGDGYDGPLGDPAVAYKLANYWYFLHPRLRAVPAEDSVVLVHLSRLTPAALAHPRERDGVLLVGLQVGGAGLGAGLARVQRPVLSLDGRPMFHHYSWVRSRAALFAKVANWGHARDRDWPALLRRALAELDAGRVPHEFVHGYALEQGGGAPLDPPPGEALQWGAEPPKPPSRGASGMR